MIRILHGDCRAILPTLQPDSIHCCVTSPPYFRQRDYNVAEQVGQEQDPQHYIETLVAIFAQMRPVLRRDGTFWLNLGDAYADKQPLMIPSRLALALQADGWILRSEIVWSKPNPMRESVKDRPVNAHEKISLFSKSRRYHYDAQAVREAAATEPHAPGNRSTGRMPSDNCVEQADRVWGADGMRNLRNVWELSTEGARGHHAAFPTELAETCIKAGCPVGGTVLDPFAGTGTTLMVADRLQRDAVGIELNPRYCQMARDRALRDGGMFAQMALDLIVSEREDPQQIELFPGG